MTPEDVQAAEREMRRGLGALLLEAPAVVVKDVEARVNAYVDALASRLAAETARADAAEEVVEATRIEAIQGVLDLMHDAGRIWEEMPADTIIPHSNGYGCWFIEKQALGTAPLKATEILARIDARALARYDAAQETR